MSTEAKEPGQRAYEAYAESLRSKSFFITPWEKLEGCSRYGFAAVEQACAVPAPAVVTPEPTGGKSELSALRLEVAAWLALAEWCAGRPQRRIDSQELFGKRNVTVQDGVGNERVSEWFDTTGPAAIDLARKLQLIPAEPDAENREGRER